VPHCAKGIGWWVLVFFGGLILAGGGWAVVVNGRESVSEVGTGSILGSVVLGGGGVAVAFLIASAINSAIGPTSTASRTDPTSITPTNPKSMFHTANLRAALTNIEGRLGSGTRTSEFLIYPGYVNVIGQRGSNQVWAVLYVGGLYREDDSGTANTGQPTFPLSQVDVTQPAALAQQLATYNHVAESQLRYMNLMLDPVSNKPKWLIYTRTGNPFTYTASTSGGSAKTGGTSKPAATGATSSGASAGATSSGAISKAESLANCVSKAGTDTAKLLACTHS
jgi:hypothetical protein